jgi:hypothetical protein
MKIWYLWMLCLESTVSMNEERYQLSEGMSKALRKNLLLRLERDYMDY